MEFDKVIRERYSVRKFDFNKEVEEDKLNTILEASRLAPTAKNMQPQRIFVCKSKESIEKIDTITRCRYNAPIVLVVCVDMNEIYEGDFGTTADIDASIVTTHMMLEATNQGIGSIWIELFDHEKIKEVLELEDNLKPVALLPIGYPTEESKPSPLHESRKELEETVTYI